MRPIIAYLLLCSTAFGADITFTAKTGTETGIQPALEAWKADETARNGGTLPNWWLWSVVAWDQDNDGKQDVLVTSHQPWGSTLLRQTGPLTFTDVTTTLIADKRLMPNEFKPVLMDIDHDGLVDLVTSSSASSPLIVNHGTSLSEGSLIKGLSLRYGTEVDVDGNGFLDRDTRGRTYGVTKLNRHRNTSGDNPPVIGFTLTTTDPEPFPADLPADVLAELEAKRLDLTTQNRYSGPVFQAVDLDNDGDQDLIVQYFGSYSGPSQKFGRYCIRNAAGQLENKTATIGIPGGLIPILPVRDCTGDGLPDVFLAYGAGSGLYKQNVDGTFSLVVNAQISSLLSSLSETYLYTVNYHDFNNDGLSDLLVAQMRLGTLGVFQNNGGGNFVQVLSAKHYDAEGWDVADMDGDGDLDVICGGPAFTEAWNPGKQTSCQFTIYVNSGVYSPPPPPPPPPVPGVLRVFINGEEKPGASVTIDGVEVPGPTGTADKVIEVSVPEPQASLRHPLDRSDVVTVAGERFLKAALHRGGR